MIEEPRIVVRQISKNVEILYQETLRKLTICHVQINFYRESGKNLKAQKPSSKNLVCMRLQMTVLINSAFRAFTIVLNN